MGWTGIFDAIRKSNGTIDRKATLEREFSGWTSGENKTTMLKGSMAGSVFYAAMETTTPAGREVWALVILTSTNGAEFCYKEMDETCGPCEASCPVSILDALTPTTNETANAWRQRCRENLEKKKAAAGRIPRNATRLYITFLRDTTASRAGESVMVYKIDGAWIYTSKTGGRWRLTAALLRNDDFIQINGTEEPTPAPLPEESTPATEANQDTTTGAQDGPTTPESNTAGENTTGADKAPEDATTRPQEGPTSDGTSASEETPTTAETAPQDATSDAGSRITCPAAGNKITSDAGTAAGSNITPGTSVAENAPERPETSTAAQDTTGSDTSPPRATEKATTGNAAGSSITPATAAGNHTRPGPAAGKNITGAGKNITPLGHACENAPGRTERAQAEQVHTTHAKSPPRAAQRATTHGRPRGHPEKTANFGRFYPLLDFPRTIFANFQGIPISVCIFGPVFDPEFWRQKQHPPGG